MGCAIVLTKTSPGRSSNKWTQKLSVCCGLKEASKRINILLCWAQDGQLFLHFDPNNFKFFDLYICLKWVVT